MPNKLLKATQYCTVFVADERTMKYFHIIVTQIFPSPGDSPGSRHWPMMVTRLMMSAAWAVRVSRGGESVESDTRHV